MTLRVDPLRQERLERLMAWKGTTLSDIVRSAIDQEYFRQEYIRSTTHYQRLKPFIGSVDSGKHGKGPFSSDDISKQVGDIIVEKWEKRGAKRPR